MLNNFLGKNGAVIATALKRLTFPIRAAISRIKLKIILKLYLKNHTLEELEQLVKDEIVPTCTHHGNKHIYKFPLGGSAVFDYTARTFQVFGVNYDRRKK